MNEQEYLDKLKVRQQLSQFDRLRVLEYEVNELKEAFIKLTIDFNKLSADFDKLVSDLMTAGKIGEEIN